MKIVNKEFHDYYDGCMSYGADKTIIYDRKRKILNEDDILVKESEKFIQNIPSDNFFNFNKNISIELYNEKNAFVLNSYMIGFCGIIYPLLKITKRKNSVCCGGTDSFIYDIDSYEKYTHENKMISKNKFKQYIFDMKKMGKYFEKIEELEFFFKIKNPIFTDIPHEDIGSRVRKRTLITNPCLKDFHFYKVIDSMSAFQKISDFLSGVLGNVHPPILEVSNKVKIHKHGFSHKYAFKKEPKQ